MKTIKVQMTLVLADDASTDWIEQSIDQCLDRDAGEDMTYCRIITTEQVEQS